MCDRCHTAEGSLAHSFWHCPILSNFWCDIFDWFSKQYGINIPPDCKLAIFGCSDRTRALSPHQKQALKAGMVAAKKIILLNWKSPLSPCFKRWLNEMLSIAKMEQILKLISWRCGNLFWYCLIRPKCISRELCCYIVSWILCKLWPMQYTDWNFGSSPPMFLFVCLFSPFSPFSFV